MTPKRELSAEQAQASDPSANVWVQANAGTGKTSVLVQRLLRILFRSNDSTLNSLHSTVNGTGILCLTYTNAGASEMRNRILAELREWAYADDDALRNLLVGVAHSNSPTDADLNAARAIFYEYIDNPQILKIRTIHSFCEEILRRFPIEAGISPSWRLVTDADQTRLMKEAFQELVNHEPGQELANAFSHIVERISEYSYDKLLGVLVDQYRTMFQLNQSFNYKKQFIDTITNFLSINPNIGREFWSPAAMDDRREILRELEAEIMSSKKPAGYLIKAGELIRKLMHDSIFDFDEYKSAFLTATGTPAVNIAKKEYLVAEQTRVYEYDQNRINQAIYDDTVALFTLSDAFTKKYAHMKLSRNLMDFDDIILYTERLFSDPAKMGWVLSQLDTNLSHILVDEAQDTSPEQWRILRALAANFFTDGDGENPRTLFVVGDTKQSIYSFQGANPDEFASSKNTIAAQIENDQRFIAEVPLEQSFRSVRAILSTVDHLFNDVSIANLANFKNNNHKCFRIGDAGLVELNPVSAPDEESTAAQARREYIKEIADKIEHIINDETLESAGRPVRASDIMVLVQKRAPFAAPLVAELKSRNITVAGSDRIRLPEFPAVRDLLNLVRFCLDTANDYALACTLKSPLFGYSETDLFAVCHNRANETVFSRVNELQPETYKELSQILDWAKLPPYSFFMRLLNTGGRRKKMIAALGAQVIDPLEEFITIALSYERTQPGDLREFIQWFMQGGSEIKRDMDTNSGVRVMTVHAAKGLDSPIVFLIDTIENPKSKREGVSKTVKITNGDAFLWSPDGAQSEKFQSAADDGLQTQIAEYYRLLYVAMTRARDRLYIYGFSTTKSPPEFAWHTMLATILPSHPDAQIDESGITKVIG